MKTLLITLTIVCQLIAVLQAGTADRHGTNLTEESEPGETVNDIDVVINLDSYVNNIDATFASVNVGAGIFRGDWRRHNFFSKQVQSLTKGIAPSYVRVGASFANFFIFETSAGREKRSRKPRAPRPRNFTVTEHDWINVKKFVEDAGWHLIFEFNQFLRKGENWDTENARELLTFSQANNFKIPFFQLGNEPNSYHLYYNFTSPPSKLVADMRQLRSLLSEFPAYQNSSILGPDVTKLTRGSGRRYTEEFLKIGGQNIVSAITLHHYYFNKKKEGASEWDFVDTTILDSLLPQLSISQEVRHALAPELPLWFSETSSVSGGGLPGVSDAYAAGFMWLDKLGLSALHGFKAVLRQSFYRGYYAMISNDFFPYPDYFLTVLFKRLVQGPVFNVTSSTETVRMYAGCANPLYQPKGAVTVYILNVQNKTATLSFPQFTGHQFEAYVLTPASSEGLRSKFVALNGHTLAMVNEELPPMPPRNVSGRISFPAYSFGFVVVPESNVTFCH